jgi:predicted RNA binding protein with dsRBD fold (UPF0201 family)
MSEVAANEPGFMISVQKQNPLSGEVISVATNLPKGAVSEDIRKAIEEITKAIDWRIPQPEFGTGIPNELFSDGN